MANQRVLKLLIRLMLPVFALGGFGGVWGLILAGSNDHRVVASAWSADKRYRASIVTAFGSSGCGRLDSAFVLVERRTLFFKTGEFTPFCLEGSSGQIALRWHGSTILEVQCSNCNQDYRYAGLNWGGLRFVYDLDRP